MPGDKDVSNQTLLDVETYVQGYRIMVKTGPRIAPEVLRPLINDRLIALDPVHYPIEVNLVGPDGRSVVLASRIGSVNRNGPQGRTDVIDSLVEPGVVHLVVGEGPLLFIWRITIGGGSVWTHFQADKAWRRAAAMYPQDRQSAPSKLGRTDDGRLTVEVFERIGRQRNYFEETEPGSLKFKLIRQWEDAGGN